MKRFTVLLCVLVCFGCNGNTTSEKLPVFELVASEYPSWSAILVASTKAGGDLINGKRGELGPVEKKWGVDIVLKEADYDACILMFSNNTVDAACLTNIDTLGCIKSRKAVAILPTSTSVGGDTCIVTNFRTIEDLKNHDTYGLEKSVSQYVFERNLVIKGKNPKDYKFKNLDPGAAAQAMQTGQKDINSIMVWNPFSLQTLRTRSDAELLFDSSLIPEEVIDCVMVGADVLAKPSGDKFACAIIDCYYQLNARLNNPATHAETLVAIGAKFSNLPLADMEVVVKHTRFYAEPATALEVFESDKFRKETMPLVVQFCVDHEIVEPNVDTNSLVGFDDDTKLLNFTGKYIKMVRDHK